MDLSDYFRLLRRFWLVLIAGALLGVALATAYLLLTPKEYEATASVVVVGISPTDIPDAAQAAQLAQNSAGTYAVVIGSAAVLAPAASTLDPQPTEQRLQADTSVAVRSETAVIDVTVTGDDATVVAQSANAVVNAAISVVPALQSRSASTSPVGLRVIQQATAPSSPTAPNSRGVVLIGIVLGLAAALVFAIVRQAVDRRLRRPEDVRKATMAPVLALLPPLRRSQRQGIVVRDDPTGAIGEAFRSLRTTVGTLTAGTRRSIVITSAGADVAGVFVATNLAWSIAQSGRTVVLLDGDLRESGVTDAIGADRGPGLADILSREAPLERVVHPAGGERLYYVGSGTPHSSPADLLSRSALADTLEALENEFDYVIVSAPPILAYTDAALVASSAAHTIVVASSARVNADELASAVESLATVKVVATGVVLTDALGADRANRRLRGFRVRSRPVEFAAPSSSTLTTEVQGGLDVAGRGE